MPSQIPQGALLAISAYASEDDDDDRMSVDNDDNADSDSRPSSVHPPWCWPAWQKRTGEDQSPFSKDFNEDGVWDSASESQAVWTYVCNFWALSDAEQIPYAQRSRSDNDKQGRLLWLNWVNKKWPSWGIYGTVDVTLAERGLDPFSIMKRLKVSKVRSFFSFCLFLLFSSLHFPCSFLISPPRRLVSAIPNWPRHSSVPTVLRPIAYASRSL